MQNLWKRLFIIAAVLLVVSLTFNGVLWYQLAKINPRIDAFETQLESLQDEQNRMLDHYAELREQINMRLGRGENAKKFITPDDPAVADKVQEIAGSYSADAKEQWRDYNRLRLWVMMSIEYTGDTYTPVLPELMDGTLEWERGYWKMPAETLVDEAGDCEDTSALLASMILNYNERRFPAWIVGIRTDGPDARSHVAIALPVENRQLTIIDVSGSHYSMFPGGSISAYDIPVAVDKWLSSWEEEMSGAYVYMAVSEYVYSEFSGTEEFIEWVNEYYEGKHF